jgi:hypothetical protein
MAARISIADLSDATGISPDLLAAEVAAIQRDSQLAPAPASERPRSTPPPPSPRPKAPAVSDVTPDTPEQAAA